MSIVLYKRTQYKGRYTAEVHSSAYKIPYSMKDIRTRKIGNMEYGARAHAARVYSLLGACAYW